MPYQMLQPLQVAFCLSFPDISFAKDLPCVISEAFTSERMMDEDYGIQTENGPHIKMGPLFACLPATCVCSPTFLALACCSTVTAPLTESQLIQILLLLHMHWHATAGVLTKLDSISVGTHASATTDNQIVPS